MPLTEDRPTPASEAQIAANRRNAERSTGPKTPEGKERSRANALKHGMTGGGALPAENAAEVERLRRSFESELKPSSDLGRTLVRRMAVMTVRMDRCAATETARLTERVLQAETDFDAEWPEEEGAADPVREKLRLGAARRAMFDPPREACLARQYDAAAERSFFRSMRVAQGRAGGPGREPGPAAGPDSTGIGFVFARRNQAGHGQEPGRRTGPKGHADGPEAGPPGRDRPDRADPGLPQLAQHAVCRLVRSGDHDRPVPLSRPGG